MARAGGKDRGLYEKNGNWYVEWYDSDGKRHRDKIGPSKSAAKQYYAKRQAEKLEGKRLPERNRKELTLEALVKRYAGETKTNKKSWEWDERHAARWVEVLGSENIERIQPGDIERVKAAWLESGGKKNGKVTPLAPATVNRRLAFLKTLFGKAVRDGLTERNPLAQRRVKMMREAAPRDRFLTPEEELALKEHLPRVEWLAWVVAVQTGLRMSEQLERTREDVNLKKGLLFIPEAKGGGRQEVRLNSVAVAALKEMLASHHHAHIFPSPDGKEHLSVNTLADRFDRARKKAGLKGVSWHVARHTFISRLCMLGVPLPTVQKLARHKSIQMTLRYAHLCPSHLQESLETLAGAYPGDLT